MSDANFCAHTSFVACISLEREWKSYRGNSAGAKAGHRVNVATVAHDTNV